MSESKHFLKETEDGVAIKSRKKAKPPYLYKVLLHNDDYTSQEFVVQVLQAVFHRSEIEASQIMLRVHRQGVGIAGAYVYEIAETKVAKVMALARQYEYPLQCTLEQE